MIAAGYEQKKDLLIIEGLVNILYVLLKIT
jgi:hypothetical protein